MNEMKPGSCQLPDRITNIDSEGAPFAKEKAMPAGLEHVPPEKLEEWRNYAKLLRKKFPQMKEARLQRKVAEHFKIKLT